MRIKYIWPFSWLFWVNFLFFQWFFIRLEETLKLVDITDTEFTHESWGLRRWVVPLTGWWTSYLYWPWRVRGGHLIRPIIDEDKAADIYQQKLDNSDLNALLKKAAEGPKK